MKKLLLILCTVTLAVMLSVTAFAEGKMYPHPEVDMEITRTEGEQKSDSGRVWKTVYGEAIRPDMEHGELRYTVYLPENYDSTKEYPFLIYLHGGETGYRRTEGATPWNMDLGKRGYAESIANGIEDCIIFAPQAPGTTVDGRSAANGYWSGLPSAKVATATEDNSPSSPYLRAAQKMMDNFLKTGISYNGNVYKLDESRLYLSGHSMGSIGSYTMLRDCPDVFAAAVLGAGIGDPGSVDLWKSTPVRIFHGTEDTTIPFKAAEVMIEALKDYPNVEFSPLVNAGHTIKPYMYVADWDDGLNDNFVWMATKDRDTNVIEGNSMKYAPVYSYLDLPEDKSVRVFFDDKEVVFSDEKPFTNTAVRLPDNTTYSPADNKAIFIPVRAVSEAAGFDVSWDGENRVVTVAKGDRVSTFTLGGDCLVNGEMKPCYYNFPLKNDRVHVSQYGICHALDCSMRWDDVNRVIYFYSKDKYPKGVDLSQGGYSGANTESAKYQEFYSEAEKAFVVPGVQEDFVPGGITYRKDTNQFYVAGYFNMERNSAIVVMDADTGVITASHMLLDIDGNVHRGKINGIALTDKDIYLTNGSNVERIALENMEDVLKVEEIINLNLGEVCTNSFVEFKDGYLWSGNYYKSDDKKYKMNAYENYGFLLKGYKLDADTGRLVKNDEADKYIPDVVYSLDRPEAIQGMTVAGNYIITAASYNTGRSVISTYDKTKTVDSDEKITLGEDIQIPVISLSCENKLNAPPYLEEITEKDGAIYTLFKSATMILRRDTNVSATDYIWKVETEKLAGSVEN